MDRFKSLPSARLLQLLAGLAAVAGLCTWAVVLSSAQAPAVGPNNVAAANDSGQDAQAAQWFSSAASNVQIKLSGLFAGERGVVAILAVDDDAPRAFLLGEQLAEGVRLRAIEGDAVVIERNGQPSRLSMPSLPLEVLPALR
jgi:general secretion pathway protein C